MDIRLRSISATSPNAKQSTLLLIVSFEGIAVFGAVKPDFFFEQFADDRHDVRKRAAQTG